MTSAFPTVFAIVQARMSSTRLPGKVLRPLHGEPMLQRVLQRLETVRLDGVAVATTTNAADDPIAEFVSQRTEFHLFRGSEHDVLARYHDAAQRLGADVVVRITADCPLVDPQVTQRCIDEFRASGCDYASNCQRRTYPRGFDTEVFPFAALDRAHRQASRPAEREHVTPHIWRNPMLYSLHDVVDSEDHSHLRLTVDTEEDFRLVEAIYREPWQPDRIFDYAAIRTLFEQRPELRTLNAAVPQKPVE